MSGLLDFLQGASNAAASNVSGPVDLLSLAMRKAGAGAIIGDAPIGSSEWMAQHGLTRATDSFAGLLGESAGLVAPIIATAMAPKIASGLLQMHANASAPSSALNTQRGGLLVGDQGASNMTSKTTYSTDGLSLEEAGSLIRGEAERFASKLRDAGYIASIEHSGSAAGPSSYVRVNDPLSGANYTTPFRISSHGKGAFGTSQVFDVARDDGFADAIRQLDANRTAKLGPPADGDSYAEMAKRLQEKLFSDIKSKQAAENIARINKISSAMALEQRAADGGVMSSSDKKLMKWLLYERSLGRVK